MSGNDYHPECKLKLKLENGSQINLSDLDKLENKSDDNALLKFFDSIGFGGNKNNIFDKKEIEKIKSFLIEMAGSDGVIDQKDIKNARLKYSSIFTNYSEKSFADDLSLLSLQNESSSGGIDFPKYKVKSGDTINKIVKNLGYTGDDAKKYADALESQLEADGSFMNSKKWLLAGSEINLLGEEKLKELGIKKSQISPTITKKNDNSSTVSSPSYRVLSGDSIPKIVKKLGYSGIDAQKYADALDKQLEADGSYMNDKKWLMAGSKIKLLSDEKLKELGIKKSETDDISVENERDNKPISEETVNSTEVPDTDGNMSEISSQRLKHIDSSQKVPQKPNDGVVSVKNSAQRILEVIKESGHKGRIVDENELNAEQKNFVRYQKQLYKANPTFIKNDSTGEVHIFFDTENSSVGKKMGLTSIEQIYGKNTQVTNRYYKNGKIVQDLKKYDEDDGVWKEVSSTLIQKPKTSGTESKKQILTPLAIDIKVDPSVYEGASDSQKETINNFVNALEKNKSTLMRDLNIDNDTYNKYAQLSCAIAMQETNFGKADSYKYWDGTVGTTLLKDTAAVIGIGLKKIAPSGIGKSAPTAVSKGLTQIKIGDWDDNPRVAKLFEKYGIKRGYYNTLTPEQSAAATVIVLNELSRTVKTEAVQNGIEASKNRYYYSKKKLVDGAPVERTGGYFIYNNVTDEDAMMYLYNGRSGTLKKGNATPSLMLYTHNIQRYKKLFSVSENPQQRADALKKAPTVTISNASNKRKEMSSDLGWGIGQVAFNTNLYTGGISKNSESEIQTLKQSLVQRGYDMKYVNSVVSKMKSGEISFLNGLTNSEISAMTEEDIKLLVEHSNSLNKKLAGVTNSKKKRQIATEADKEFKKIYLASHARQVYLNKVSDSSVILNDQVESNVKKYPQNGYNTGAQKRCKKYLTQLRGSHQPDSGIYMYSDRVNKGLYTGFNVERDKGINYVNASDVDILLAQNGADSANTLRTSGACLTGAKQALIGSGCVEPEEMSTFNNAFQLAKFLEKHPDRFQEIKYVQISDEVAREITAGDISSLPAGCIVVFGNKSRTDVPGHAGITSGNGQIYADETDNSNWDNFVAKSKNHNGKGEHGYVRVFRLNPEYYTIDPKTHKVIAK